ncbi:MAG: DNA-directed RNA polymerase subunit H [Candidatus Woesearchaeota archaeon]|jgi:DNA-directed RNA polymerase subunit H (RpoH/RPB5)|nr:DNA-directed RNA polymerase subunit H [Candidatus Woesearchaeota archaeon]MDP7458047.1 DNA-directed RNA polymerase subunit H [Candidatus Woesearchaeota archaeon]
MAKFDISKHHLVPKHTKLNDKEKEDLLENYKISIANLPKIFLKDSAITGLKAKEGDVIKIIRKNPRVGEVVFYRCVING